jgi:HEAT repeat protein
VSLVLVALLAVGAAVCLTLGLTLGARVWGGLRARRLERYRAAIQDHLLAYVVEARDDPPPAPQGRLQQRVIRQRLVELAPSVKGDSHRRLCALFRSFALVPAARADLDARDALTRVHAVDALAAMRVREAAPWLLERLPVSDTLLVLACARALAALEAVDALPAVMTALVGTGAEPGEVSEILLAFGPAGVPYLCERLVDGGAAERRLSAASLGEIRAIAASPALRAALLDCDDEVAAGAARALGQVGDGGAAGDIVAALGAADRPWFVRVAAAGALGALDDPATAPALAAALAEEQWDVRSAASRALTSLGEAGVDAVVAALDELPGGAVSHFAGILDVEDRLSTLIARAAAGDGGADRLVRRAARAGVHARLDEVAAGTHTAAGYARTVLQGDAVPA